MPTTNDPRNELRQEIRQILDTTARVDERFKTMVERQHEFSTRLQAVSDQLATLQSRLTVVESKNGESAKKYAEAVAHEVRELALKVEKLDLAGSVPTKKATTDIEAIEEKINDLENRLEGIEKHSGDWSNRMKAAGIEIFKIVLAMVAAYLLFRWGIK